MKNEYCLDIETTGLEPLNTQLVCFTISRMDSDDMRTIFVEDDKPEAEKEAMKWLDNYLKEDATVFTWRPFDFLYISGRCGILGVENPFKGYRKSVVDVHEYLIRNEKKFDRDAVDHPSTTDLSGEFVPEFYREYLARASDDEKEEMKEKLLEYNRNDVKWLKNMVKEYLYEKRR